MRGATVNNGGIYIYNMTLAVTSNTVEGQASSTWGAGILVDSSNRVTNAGNTVSNSTVDGIRLMNADNSTVSGNTTYNTGGSSYNGGIIIGGDSDNNTITGNNLTDVTTHHHQLRY